MKLGNKPENSLDSDVKEFLEKIQEMLEDSQERFEFARDTLEGIATQCHQNNSFSSGQERAVKNIAASIHKKSKPGRRNPASRYY